MESGTRGGEGGVGIHPGEILNVEGKIRTKMGKKRDAEGENPHLFFSTRGPESKIEGKSLRNICRCGTTRGGKDVDNACMGREKKEKKKKEKKKQTGRSLKKKKKKGGGKGGEFAKLIDNWEGRRKWCGGGRSVTRKNASCLDGEERERGKEISNNVMPGRHRRGRKLKKKKKKKKKKVEKEPRANGKM